MRAVSVAFSPGRPSRLKNEPGILPVAYMRSSTSTVKGRKSTSRSEPATAVARTMVSPWRTTTAPEACLAILPVSNEISLPAISTETRVIPSLLIFTAFLYHPSVGGLFLFYFPNGRSLADRGRCLLAEAELLDEGAVALEVAAAQVVEEAAAAADQHQQTAARVVILGLLAQVLGQMVDALGQQRDLDLGGAHVLLICAE